MFAKIKEFFRGYEATGAIEYIVVGLGNPGTQYAQTRHNAGFMAIDFITGKIGVNPNRLKFKSLCGDGMLGGKRVLFLKPTTYMNLSGEAVTEAMAFYKVVPEKVLVLLDDSTLPVGGLRLRRKGSDGGQKGMRSIITLSGKDTFPRIKIGIGQKPRPEMDLADWVLSKFTGPDLKQLEATWPDLYKAVEMIVSGDMDTAMQTYNVRGMGKQEQEDS